MGHRKTSNRDYKLSFIKTKRTSIKMPRSSNNDSHLCRAVTILLLLSGTVTAIETTHRSKPTPSCSGVTDNFVQYTSGLHSGFYVEVDTSSCGDQSYYRNNGLRWKMAKPAHGSN